MINAIGSKKDLKDELYYNYISDIIESSLLQDLKQYTHHVYTTRFQHSINVSYYNYKVCHFFGLDEKAGARAGLLHDLYFYSTNNRPSKLHLKNHPQIALKNASENFCLSPIEKDIISKHMFPITKERPKYKETYVIIFVDKYCALVENLFCRLQKLSALLPRQCRRVS
ncbi:MAG: HAD family hydrolase [Ruminococcus sp.]|nr:HAD family hydrolase [Ruminococcus sp.]